MAAGMMTLEEEMEAFGEVMPKPQYGGNNPENLDQPKDDFSGEEDGWEGLAALLGKELLIDPRRSGLDATQQSGSLNHFDMEDRPCVKSGSA